MSRTMGKGFMVQTIITDGEGRELRGEILYWESLDGLTTLKSNERRFSNDFDQPSLSWVYVTTLPADREFIGNYPIPNGIR